MKTRAVHVNAVRLGDYVPDMGGEVIRHLDTATRRYFWIVTPTGFHRMRWRLRDAKVPVAERRQRA